jgi:hypothetical protein
MDALSNKPNVRVAGLGEAELPVPAWVRWSRILLAAAGSGALLCGCFALWGWSWVTGDSWLAAAALGTLVVAAAAAIAVAAARTRFFDRLLGIKGTGEDRHFVGFRSWLEVLPAAFVLFVECAGAGAAAWHSVRTCPIPSMYSKVRYEILPPGRDEGLVPVYLWDYATWFDPAWLDKYNLLLPYEKGPPQKLLPKVFFESTDKRVVELELHGRRPRSYPAEQVHAIFDSASPVVSPLRWPLVWLLLREAGLIVAGEGPPILYLIRVGQGSSNVTQAIGVPWESAPLRGETLDKSGSGRFFFWGPDGSVFQARCARPCRLARLLELVQFPPDPRGSHVERLEWTKAAIRKLLDAPMPAPESAERRRHESLLTLYLVSLLTLDPRDPETFFHLGKLARNRETISSAIRYGRDLGMDPARILELEATAEKL